MHTLGEEVAIASDLAALHQLLLGERLSWTVEVAEGVGTLPVPALILQPLIENALKFAGTTTGRGVVSVSAGRATDHLRITINNSIGHASRQGTGRGLSMVRDRLRAVYGSGAELNTREVSDGYRATMILPDGRG